jgi:septal ring factor EnvC (AmiA/AmiB activator)
MVVSFLTVAAVNAQEKTKRAEKINQKEQLSPQQRAVAAIAKMKTVIELDENQEAQLKEELTVYFTDMQAVKKEMKALKDKSDEIKKSHKEKMKTILTEEQRAKLKEAKDKKKEEIKKS